MNGEKDYQRSTFNTNGYKPTNFNEVIHFNNKKNQIFLF